jgi:hypothetical protein
MLDASGPASVQDLAAPVANRNGGLIGHKVGTAFSPGEVNIDEASIGHTEVVPHRLLGAAEESGDRERRLCTVSEGA